MTALVQAALRVRRTARSTWGLAAAFLLAAFLLAGFFVPGSRALGWGHLAWLACWAAPFGYRAWNAHRHGTDEKSAFELGAFLIVGVQALIQLRGGVDSELYPLSYVAVALVASFATGRAGIGLVAFALALGLATAFLGEHVRDPVLLGLMLISTGLVI